MSVVSHLLEPFRHGEHAWCCERCHQAAIAGAAARSGHLAGQTAHSALGIHGQVVHFPTTPPAVQPSLQQPA